MALLTGVISYACGSGNQTTYIRMAVVMVVFYIIGVFIRNTLQTINTELDERREREQQREMEAAQAEYAAKAAAKQNEAGHGHRVDLVAGDPGEEFIPMTVSQAIGTKLKE